MKKIFLILIGIAICLNSCRKDDNDSSTGVEIKTLFDDSKDPNKQMSNIRVGQQIPFQLTITGAKSDNIKYKIYPVKIAYKHQEVLKDYEVAVEGDLNDLANIHIDRVTGEMIFRKPGTYKFYIKPLIAGSFILKFKSAKVQEEKASEEEMGVTYIIDKDKKDLIRFQAVDLKAWVENVQIGNMYKNVFYFSIDDGPESWDNFLTSYNGRKQEYLLQYNGKDYRID